MTSAAELDANQVVKADALSSTLAAAANLSVSPELVAWLHKCPLPAEFGELLQDFHWRETVVDCSECGEPAKRTDLAVDQVTPYGDGTGLLCRDCWAFFTDPEQFIHYGEDAELIYHKPFPSQPPERRAPNPVVLVDGEIRDEKDRRIGVAQGYNRSSHCAQKVTLDDVGKAGAEAGMLDPSWRVVSHDLVLACAATKKRPPPDALGATPNADGKRPRVEH